VLFDPRDWVLKKLTFEKSKQELLDQLANDPNMICRVRAAQALADQSSQRDVLDALVRAAAGDKFWAVRAEAIEAIGKASGKVARKSLLAAAAGDKKSKVRIAAIRQLHRHSHDSTRVALRKIIGEDPSYYAAAEALRSLAKVDRKTAAADLYAALPRTSHGEVILRAAADSLADLDDGRALGKLVALLGEPSTPQRRMAVMNAVAKLGRGEPEATAAIATQLDDSRSQVRRAAASAMAQTGDPEAIDTLLARRGKERGRREIQSIDDAVKKLRDRTRLGSVQQQVEALRKKNRELETRLRQVEENKGSRVLP
jgi:aminopeptidase N